VTSNVSSRVVFSLYLMSNPSWRILDPEVICSSLTVDNLIVSIPAKLRDFFIFLMGNLFAFFALTRLEARTLN
jgi:hypothetical protein